MSFPKTLAALQSYDDSRRRGNDGDADLVRVAFWLEASTDVRARVPNPSVDEVRAVLMIAGQHEWQFYMNGSFCRKCGAAIGDPRECGR